MKLRELSRLRLAVRYQARSNSQFSDLILNASEPGDQYDPKRGREVVVKLTISSPRLLKLTGFSRPRPAMRYQASSEFQCSDITIDASEPIDHHLPKRDGEATVNLVVLRSFRSREKSRALATASGGEVSSQSSVQVLIYSSPCVRAYTVIWSQTRWRLDGEAEKRTDFAATPNRLKFITLSPPGLAVSYQATSDFELSGIIVDVSEPIEH